MCFKVKWLFVLVVLSLSDIYPAIYLPIRRNKDLRSWQESILNEEPLEIVAIEGNLNNEENHWDLEFTAFER